MFMSSESGCPIPPAAPSTATLNPALLACSPVCAAEATDCIERPAPPPFIARLIPPGALPRDVPVSAALFRAPETPTILSYGDAPVSLRLSPLMETA